MMNIRSTIPVRHVVAYSLISTSSNDLNVQIGRNNMNPVHDEYLKLLNERIINFHEAINNKPLIEEWLMHFVVHYSCTLSDKRFINKY